MAKGSPVKKVVNGEIADADDVNQIVLDVGTQGGLIPYDPNTNDQDTTGSQSIGSTAFPWGSLFVNQNGSFVEVDPSTNTASAMIAMNLLRKFISMKDAPGGGVGSYTGFGGDVVSVKTDESGLEFTAPSDIPKNIQVFTSSGTWTRPTGVSKVYVKVIGAGGNGASGSGNGAGGGGGGGGYAEGLISVTGNVTVTIGATNSFAGSTTIQATNGSNGTASSGSGSSFVNGAGGAGGAGSNGTINLTGATGAGGAGASAFSTGGCGGGSAMGPGGGGGRAGNTAGGTGGSGGSGGGYGGGGGGGGTSSGSPGAGGSGDPGAVIIYW